MKSKKLIFNVLTVLFVIILITWFTELNYQDLSFRKNISPYFGIISSSLFILVMQMIKRSTTAKDKNE